MKTKLTIVSGLIAIAAFGTVAQAQSSVPPNVDNVRGELRDGALTVMWDAVEDPAGIAFYRLYYSRQSIMDNAGNYDDFEQTADNQTNYTFAELPAGDDVYISVLAVNTEGVESESFLSEAHVHLVEETRSSSSAESSDVSSVTSSEGAQFVLREAEADSLTGVILRFSRPLDPASQIAPEDIIVLDMSGTKLDVSSVTVQGNNLKLETTPQTPEKKYVIATFGNARDAQGNVAVTLSQIDFFGFMNGMPSSSVPSGDTTPPEDATGLRLVPKLLANGLYTVFSFWNPSKDSAGDLKSYEVEISEDGLAYVRSASLSENAREAKHENIRPGTFGVRVKTKDEAGNESEGITKVINLPQSGLGLLGITLLSGAIAGRKMLRKKKESM